MALTITPVESFVLGDRRENVFDIAFDASYRTGGLSLTPAQLGYFELTWVAPLVASSGHTFHYDEASERLLAFDAGVEVTDSADLSRVAVRVITRGKGRAVA